MAEDLELSVAEMGRRLREAVRLDTLPLCVYESGSAPTKSRPFSQVDRCLAKATYLCANGAVGPLHLGLQARNGICPGGQFWTGLSGMSEGLKHFISCGSPSFRDGAAEHLKRDPEMVTSSLSRVGRIRAPDDFLCIVPCQDYQPGAGRPRAVLIFADAESTRNLLALHHYGTPEVFTSSGAPWGPSCASFLSYPAGLSPNCPDHMTVIGPVDPTGNEWLPPNIMSLGIPIDVVKRMTSDLDGSFLVKRPTVAFPVR